MIVCVTIGQHDVDYIPTLFALHNNRTWYNLGYIRRLSCQYYYTLLFTWSDSNALPITNDNIGHNWLFLAWAVHLSENQTNHSKLSELLDSL